jgi:PBP1b-binding outer membrane lipoprotein LpoB
MSSRAFFVAVVLALLLSGCSKGFDNDANVESAKKTIRTMWEKDGFTVTEVAMVRENANKLTGYVKLEKKVSILPTLKVTKTCTATMDTGGDKFLTHCE